MFFLPILLLGALASSEELLHKLNDQHTLSNESITSHRAQKPVTIINKIDESMLKYKHWTGTHEPESFSIQINGKTVEKGEKYEVTTPHEPLTIRYDYSFAKGMYKGGKTMSYQIDSEKSEADLTFSWNDDPRVIVENAKIIP